MPDRRLATSDRPSRRRSALVALALTCALLGAALAAVTATGASDRSSRAGTTFVDGSGRQDDAALERLLAEQVAVEQRRRSPEARTQRKRTRTAFAELAPDAAIQLGRQAFREQLAAKPWRSIELAEGQRVERYLGDRAARLARLGEPDAIVESSLPLRAEDEQGEKAPIDLSLRDAGAHLEPVNPLVPVTFSKDPREGATLEASDVSVALVGVGGQASVNEVGDRVVVPEALVDTEAWMAPRPGGFQTFATLRSAASPEQLVYEVDMPAGAELRAAPGGAAEVIRSADDRRLAVISAPRAWDADGESVDVGMTLDGSRLVLDVAHRGTDVRYPLLVDPEISEAWNWNTVHSGLAGWSRFGGGGWFDSDYLELPHRWGDGLYVFTRNGAYVPQWASAGFAFHPPGGSTFVFHGWAELSHAAYQSCASVKVVPGAPSAGSCGNLNFEILEACGIPCDPTGTPNGGNGASLAMELSSTAASTRTEGTKAIAAITAAQAWYTDLDLPTVMGISHSLPSGWVQSGNGSVSGTVADAGIGVRAATVEISDTDWVHGFDPDCLGTSFDTCPPSIGISASIDTSDPELEGEADEGRHTVDVWAVDALGNEATQTVGELKIDRGKPSIALSGALWDGRWVTPGENVLSSGSHQLTINATDGNLGGSPANHRSGVRSVEVSLDGEQVLAPNDVACPGSSCPMSRTWTLATGEFPAGLHTIAVSAKDHAGNQDTKTFQVKVPPAGELTWPGVGTATSRWLPLQARADTSGYSTVRFQYRRPGNAWLDIPVGTMVTETGEPLSAADLPLTDNLSARVHWDVGKALPVLMGGGSEQQLQIRARFAGGNGGTSKTVPVMFDQRGLSTDDATADVGPGTVNLATGNLSVSAEDASVATWGSPVSLARTLNSRDPGAEVNGPFGPGWVVSTPVGEASSFSALELLPDLGSIPLARVTLVDGGAMYFLKLNGQWVGADPSQAGLKLSESTATRFELKADSGVTFVFDRLAGTTAQKYMPVEVRQPGSANTATMAYEIVAGKPRPKRLLAPTPAGVGCANHNTRGCRSLTLVYATATTASGGSEGSWGDYADRVQRVELTAWDPETSAMRTDAVAQYLYDNAGRLRAQWDPRVSPALKQRYSYDAGGRLSQVSSASSPPISLAYAQLPDDQDGGRLASSSVATPQGPATSTLAYSVAVSGLAAPHQMGANDVAAWGQADLPLTATAVFPPDAVPGSNPPSDYSRATIHYLNRSGRAVNTVAPGGATSTSEYDAYGNAKRELSPANRQRALAAGGLSAAVASRLDVRREYQDEGLELVEELGPEHEVELANGTVEQVRKRTVLGYDEGAPSGTNPHLVTSKSVTAQYGGGGSSVDERLTRTQYNWTLLAPTRTIVDPAGLNLVRDFAYDAATRQQISATTPKAGSARRLTRYYQAGAHGDPSCGDRPEWAGLVCKTLQADGTSVAPPPPPAPGSTVKRFTYNHLHQVASEIRDADGEETWTETVYDAAGRPLSTKSGATGDAQGLVAAYGFEEASGGAVADSSGKGNGGTVENGAVRSSEGRYGRALRFDGTDDRVRVPDSASLDLGDETTLSAWVRPDTLTGEARNVISRGNAIAGCAAPNYALQAYGTTGATAPRGARCNVWTDAPAASALRPGVWSHIAVTREGATQRVFVNGERVAQGSVAAGAVNTVGDLLIGDGSGGQFAGLIDEVRIYERGLAGNELRADMLRPVDPAAIGVPAGRPGLLGAYGFEEGATHGDQIRDSSPNGAHGTLMGGVRTPGRHGAALVSPLVSVPWTATQNLGAAMTVSAWVATPANTANTATVVERSGAYRLQTTANSVSFQVTAGGQTRTVLAPIPTNQAVHVAGTYNGSMVRVYVNGVQGPQTQFLTGSVGPSGSPLMIGSAADRTVDDIRLYGSALTPTQIAEDAARGVTDVRRIANDAGASLPKVTATYDAATGRPTTISTTESGVTRTITTGYDSMGRVTSYTDADGNTSTTSYDLLGRPTSVDDGKGTQTFGYDGTTGLLTELDDSHAGTFTAAYDVEGRLISQTYPNGLTAETVYDESGAADGLTYTKQECSANCVWFEEHQRSSVHDQVLRRESSLSTQLYGYDGVGRLVQVRDTPAGQDCVTRAYAYDANSNRTSRTVHPAGSGGVCDTGSSGATQSSTYDSLDRVVNAGFQYDAFGRTATVPTTHSGGAALNTTYYANDLVRTQTQGTVSKGWLLDPTQTRARATMPSGTVQEVMHYSDSSDSPAWTAVLDNGVEQSWERTVTGIDGGLAAIVSDDGEDTTVELQLANLHGDITATASTDTGATAPTATFESDEFGNPRQGDAKKYGWLGGKERRSVLPSGVIQMGVRSYVPAMGRFTSVDPVVGGSANDYDYSNADPINQMDLDGRLPQVVRNIGNYIKDGWEDMRRTRSMMDPMYDLNESCAVGAAKTVLNWRPKKFWKVPTPHQAFKGCVKSMVSGAITASSWWNNMMGDLRRLRKNIFCSWTGSQEAPCVYNNYKKHPCGPVPANRPYRKCRP